MEQQIDYDHDLNRHLHTVAGARAVLQMIFAGEVPGSVLDVGCGLGTWMRAAADLNVVRVRGIEGIDLPASKLHVPKEWMQNMDLNSGFDLNEQFDWVFCLEAAEHLEPASAAGLVRSLVSHGRRILFSAAAPGQGGTHHVNCQWPEYWQKLFNDAGFVCDDTLRWRIWENTGIEAWYRQNLFQASWNPDNAGKEPRMRRVIHPDLLQSYSEVFFPELRDRIEAGGLPWKWYIQACGKAAAAKLKARREA